MLLLRALVVLLAWLAAVSAQAGDLQVDLLGWRLQQFDHGVERVLGAPLRTLESDGRVQRAFLVGRHAYLVIATDPQRPHYIDALQFTGELPGPELIHGLHLGDPREKVIAALGPPDRIKPLDISPVPPLEVEVYEYDDRNYSVEIDPQGRLFSVRLFTSRGLLAPPRDGPADDAWEELVSAAESGDFSQLEPHLRPDVEVYRSNELLSNTRRHRDFVAAPPPDLLDAFFNRSTGVASAGDAAPEAFTRLTDRMGPGLVYKFPADSVLQEVVFFPYLGRWRVYEVRFRGAFDPALPVERG